MYNNSARTLPEEKPVSIARLNYKSHRKDWGPLIFVAAALSAAGSVLAIWAAVA